MRLQHLTPIPSGASLAEIATELMEHLDAATGTRTNQDGRSVAQRFQEKRRLLRALPQRPFEARHIEPVAVSRQALVRVDGACYSVPSHWSSSQATAYVGVADIVLEWRQERITVAKQPRGGRAVRYRHYLDELAKKPQAVRQMAPEVTAELGAPYVRLWELLVSRYGKPDAARVLAKLIGAIVDHGEQQVGQILEDMLATPPHVPAPRRVTPATVPVPDALRKYQVESTPASTYNVLLAGGPMSELNDAVIAEHAKTLKLPALRRECGQLARQAGAESWSYEEYLRELLDTEVRAREASTTHAGCPKHVSRTSRPSARSTGLPWRALPSSRSSNWQPVSSSNSPRTWSSPVRSAPENRIWPSLWASKLPSGASGCCS